MDGVVTVTPRSIDAETYVEGQRISETTMLQSGMKVQFGSSHVFKFVDPTQDHIIPKRPIDASLMVKGPRHKTGWVKFIFFLLRWSGEPLEKNREWVHYKQPVTRVWL